MESSAASPAALNLLPWLLPWGTSSGQGAAATCHFCSTAFSLAPHPVLTKPKQAVLQRSCRASQILLNQPLRFFASFSGSEKDEGKAQGCCVTIRGELQTPEGQQGQELDLSLPPVLLTRTGARLYPLVSFAQGQLYIPGPELNALYTLE